MAGVTVAISFWLPSRPGREPVRAVSMERVQARQAQSDVQSEGEIVYQSFDCI